MNKHSTREEQIFDEALKQASDAERSAFLNDACRDHPELRARLELMLEGHFRAEKFLDDRPDSVSCATDEAIGSSIGRYKLLEKIGEGGFGVVYAAEQKEPVKRRVALKIIKLGMDTKQVVARFEAERQALALMDHPNIAKVHDGGATETGRPYFVMELVRGIPITKYCGENNLSVRERLSLFMSVCHAVQHAHQKGIIHRDLKPSNILVTVNDGVAVPKVIDFGVAKATQQELTEKTIFTQFHHFIGTPAYMSPEQAEMTSVDIDTRTDVYALGVLLYELLTGKTPFDGKELLASGLDEMRRIIREKEPVRPSTRLGRERASAKPATLDPQSAIDSDLDWIVMKCLEKDRNRRYGTANGLAMDLERHLNNEPVAARPPSATYRVQKWVRRHKAQFAMLVIIATILIVASAVSTWQALRATRAQQAFQEQAETSATVKNFLLKQLLGSGDTWEGRSFDTNNRALVQRIAREIEDKFTNQPLVEAEIRYALGNAMFSMDDLPEALSQYEKAFAIRSNRLGLAHSDTLLAASGIGGSLYHLGRDREGDRVLDDAIETARAAVQIRTEGAAEALFTRGWRLSFKSRNTEAMPYLREALASFQSALGEDNSRTSAGHLMIATATHGLGRFKDAGQLFEAGLRDCVRFHGTNHSMVAIFLKSHALLLIDEKRYDEAIAKLQSAIVIQRQTLSLDNQYTLESEGYLAVALEKKGDVEEAVRRGRNLHRRWAQFLPYDMARRRILQLADFFVRNHRYAEAGAAFADLKQAYTLIPPEQPEQFETLLRATAATEGWGTAAAVCRANLDCFPESLLTWLNKAWIFRYVGDDEAYQKIVEKVLALPPGDQHAQIEIAALGQPALSEAQVQQLDSLILTLKTVLPTRETDQQVWGYRAIAHLQLRFGRLESCLDSLEQSFSKQPSPDSYALFIKACCLYRLGRIAGARAAFADANLRMESLLPTPLRESEHFLTPWQIYQLLVMQRETQALFANDSK